MRDYPVCSFCGVEINQGAYEEWDDTTIYHPYCAVMMKSRLSQYSVQATEDETEKELVVALLKDVNPDNIWLEDFEKRFLYWVGEKREHPISVEWDGVAL